MHPKSNQNSTVSTSTRRWFCITRSSRCLIIILYVNYSIWTFFARDHLEILVKSHHPSHQDGVFPIIHLAKMGVIFLFLERIVLKHWFHLTWWVIRIRMPECTNHSCMALAHSYDYLYTLIDNVPSYINDRIRGVFIRGQVIPHPRFYWHFFPPPWFFLPFLPTSLIFLAFFPTFLIF